MASTLNQPLSQALTPKRSRLLPTLLLVLGVMMALIAAAYGYIQQQRTEQVTIAVRPLRFGQQVTAEDLATIEVPLHRPQQLAGITNPQLIVGRWATRDVGVNDLLQPSMLTDVQPDKPVYPSGEELQKDMVVLPFSTGTIGPINHRDVVNLGFNDPQGNLERCQNAGGKVIAAAAGQAGTAGEPYACRLVSNVNVLYIDEGSRIAYLELTPQAAHAIWALQASGLQLWGERYGSTSQPLDSLNRLSASEITPDQVNIPGAIVEPQPSNAPETKP